ncbi:MAG: diguanylate cyclase domain-containing protein, partial [Nitrospiria bacterium]
MIKNRIAELKTIADLKVTKIDNFFQERRNNIETILDNPDLKVLLPAIIKFKNDRGSNTYLSTKARLDKILKVKQVIYDYIDVMLVDTGGEIVYASNAEHEQKDLGQFLPGPDNKAFEIRQEKIYITDPFINNRENNIPAFLITAPLHDTFGKWLGLIVFELGMTPIYRFIQDRSGLGVSGETLIGMKVGDSALFLNSVRHAETPALQKKVRLRDKKAMPIQKAVQGENGHGLSYDYRSRETIAAWRYIPLLGWGMVAKIDTEEAFEPIETQKQFLMLVSAVTLFLGGGIFIVIARSITHPINAIQDGMAKVKQGHLDHRLEINSKGEVAPLIHLFNEMVDEINHRNKDLNDFKYALNAAAIVSVTDLNGNILFANDNFCRISKYSREELLGNNGEILSTRDQSEAFVKEMWLTVSGGGVWRGNFKNKAKDGTFYWVDMTIVPFLDEQGKPYQYLSIQVDITHRKISEEKVFHMAHYDDLTGLPNRVLFKRELENILAKRRADKRPFALMFLDLDQFKLVNDTLGHPSGDQLLQEVSRRLKDCLHGKDIVARMSGDEFILLLPGIGKKEDASILAQKIIAALKKPTYVEGEELFVTCSIGISLYPDHGETTLTLMKNADTAMYHAKKIGRGKFQTYSPKAQVMGGKSLSLTSALYHAIEREEFTLHYQPIVDLNRGKISGMEALIRWSREGQGVISPADFIPLAEKTGLILP